MRQSRFTEAQIVQILKTAEAGMGTDELCRKHGISRQTFYRWLSKYGGLEVDEAKRLKAFEGRPQGIFERTTRSASGGRRR